MEQATEQFFNIPKDENWYQDNGEEWNENDWDENSIIHIIPAEKKMSVQ